MSLSSSASTAYTSRQKRKPKIKWPDWLTKSLSILKPPEKLTVSEWADKNRELSEKSAAVPGRWRTSRTPYLKEIMDSFNNPDIEEIIFVKCTQVGGTEALNNMLGYVIAQDPSPVLIVYPTLTLAESISKNRLQPMIEMSRSTADKFKPNDSKDLELQFDGMYIIIAGANSPASLASYPIRVVLMDEVDKYKSNAGKEASPKALAKERQNTYNTNKKTYQASTPVGKDGIWKEWETADDQRKYFVPCPHCGHMQTFELKQIKCAESASTNEESKNTAYYECIECKGRILDAHKPVMLANGKWRSINNPKCSTKTAYSINAIYSPWKRFGEVLYQYLVTEDNPEDFQNFINSWMGMPWEQTAVLMSTDIVLERQSKYPVCIVPDDALILTAGIDVQKDHFYWIVRAWGKRMTSWNIEHGVCQSFDDLEDVLNKSYFDSAGKEYIINLACIDSGYNTDEIYAFCFANAAWLKPVKGSSSPLVDRYKKSVIDKPDSKANGQELYIVDTAQYKDMITTRLNKENGPGSWMVYKGCDRKYAEMITSEKKIKEKTIGDRDIFLWKLKEKAENHWLDAEVYAATAADILGVRYLGAVKPEEEPPHPPKQDTQSYVQADDNWIKVGGEWLHDHR